MTTPKPRPEPAVKPIHRLASVELIYRATLDMQPLPEHQFNSWRDNCSCYLACGCTVGIRAVPTPDGWEYMPFVCQRIHTKSPARTNRNPEREMVRRIPESGRVGLRQRAAEIAADRMADIHEGSQRTETNIET